MELTIGGEDFEEVDHDFAFHVNFPEDFDLDQEQIEHIQESLTEYEDHDPEPEVWGVSGVVMPANTIVGNESNDSVVYPREVLEPMADCGDVPVYDGRDVQIPQWNGLVGSVVDVYTDFNGDLMFNANITDEDIIDQIRDDRVDIMPRISVTIGESPLRNVDYVESANIEQLFVTSEPVENIEGVTEIIPGGFDE